MDADICSFYRIRARTPDHVRLYRRRSRRKPPAVLDVFFENMVALSPRRNLKRPAVKSMPAAMEAARPWNLIIGLGTPPVLTPRDRD